MGLKRNKNEKTNFSVKLKDKLLFETKSLTSLSKFIYQLKYVAKISRTKSNTDLFLIAPFVCDKYSSLASIFKGMTTSKDYASAIIELNDKWDVKIFEDDEDITDEFEWDDVETDKDYIEIKNFIESNISSMKLDDVTKKLLIGMMTTIGELQNEISVLKKK
jgi:hypothetical protein